MINIIKLEKQRYNLSNLKEISEKIKKIEFPVKGRLIVKENISKSNFQNVFDVTKNFVDGYITYFFDVYHKNYNLLNNLNINTIFKIGNLIISK